MWRTGLSAADLRAIFRGRGDKITPRPADSIPSQMIGENTEPEYDVLPATPFTKCREFPSILYVIVSHNGRPALERQGLSRIRIIRSIDV